MVGWLMMNWTACDVLCQDLTGGSVGNRGKSVFVVGKWRYLSTSRTLVVVWSVTVRKSAGFEEAVYVLILLVCFEARLC
jgi:hypothetical protein